MDTQKQAEPTMEEILASIRRIISEDGQDAAETPQTGPSDAGPSDAAGPERAVPAGRGPADDHGAEPETDDVLELTEVVPEAPPTGMNDGMVSRARESARTAQDDIDAIMNMDAPPVPPQRERVAEPFMDEVSEEESPPPRARPEPVGYEPERPSPPSAPDVPPREAFRESPADPASAPVPDGPMLSAAAAAASGAAFAGLADALRGRHGIAGGTVIGAGVTLEDLVREMLRPMLKDWLDANLPGMVERLVQREIARIARGAGEE